MTKVYGSAPVAVGYDNTRVEEMFFYQYLPIKLEGSCPITIPDRLLIIEPIVQMCVEDFTENIADPEGFYIYLTAKRLFIQQGCGLNRGGWHTDGFGSDDINYIWFDAYPTLYIEGEFKDIPNDHIASLGVFENLAKTVEIKACDTHTIYRLNDTVIHTQNNLIGEPGLRTFVKVSFSKEKYNLKGNSHNYLLDYDWEMKDRDVHRNHPVK